MGNPRKAGCVRYMRICPWLDSFYDPQSAQSDLVEARHHLPYDDPADRELLEHAVFTIPGLSRQQKKAWLRRLLNGDEGPLAALSLLHARYIHRLDITTVWASPEDLLEMLRCMQQSYDSASFPFLRHLTIDEDEGFVPEVFSLIHTIVDQSPRLDCVDFSFQPNSRFASRNLTEDEESARPKLPCSSVTKLKIKESLPEGQDLSALIRRFIALKEFVLCAVIKPMRRDDNQMIEDIFLTLSPLANSLESLTFLVKGNNPPLLDRDVSQFSRFRHLRVSSLLLLPVLKKSAESMTKKARSLPRQKAILQPISLPSLIEGVDVQCPDDMSDHLFIDALGSLMKRPAPHGLKSVRVAFDSEECMQRHRMTATHVQAWADATDATESEVEWFCAEFVPFSDWATDDALWNSSMDCESD